MFYSRKDQNKIIAALTNALSNMVYETTHLSPVEDDGSHCCRISGEALEQSRNALKLVKREAA